MHTYWTSMLWSIDSCQNRYPLTSITWPYRGLRCRPIKVKYFFEVIRWRVTSFQMIAASSLFFFFTLIWNTSCISAAQLKSLFQTDLGSENFSQLLLAGKTVAFDFAHHDHALVRFFVQFLFCDWSKFDRWVYAENMQHLESCLLWELKLTEFRVNLWCF